METLSGLIPRLRAAAAHHRLLSSALRSTIALISLVIANALGRIPIPGTPVGITLQTGTLMCMALALSLSEITAAVGAYIALGAMGAPVFSGGMSQLHLSPHCWPAQHGPIPQQRIAGIHTKRCSHCAMPLPVQQGLWPPFTALALGCKALLRISLLCLCFMHPRRSSSLIP